VTSVTTGRTEKRSNLLGSYLFRHIKPGWFRDYRRIEVAPGQRVFLATPEKALLDLVYLTPEGDRPAFLKELRLQANERMDPSRLTALANSEAGPKLKRAASRITRLLGGPSRVWS